MVLVGGDGLLRDLVKAERRNVVEGLVLQPHNHVVVQAELHLLHLVTICGSWRESLDKLVHHYLRFSVVLEALIDYVFALGLV